MTTVTTVKHFCDLTGREIDPERHGVYSVVIRDDEGSEILKLDLHPNTAHDLRHELTKRKKTS